MLHKLAKFLWPKFCQLCMLSHLERENIQQEARRRIASFTSDAELVDEPVTKSSNTIMAEFEEWVNMPISETVDKVTQ